MQDSEDSVTHTNRMPSFGAKPQTHEVKVLNRAAGVTGLGLQVGLGEADGVKDKLLSVSALSAAV